MIPLSFGNEMVLPDTMPLLAFKIMPVTFIMHQSTFIDTKSSMKIFWQACTAVIM